MITNPGLAQFKFSFEISPVIMTNGIAANIPGGMLPIISITEAQNYPDGILAPSEDLALDEYFAHFRPIPGGTLIDNSIGEYPFANQATAANAIIANPFVISLMMICPVRESYSQKLAIMTALQSAFAQHNNLGGTYTILTPFFFYTDCVMTGMRDATSGESNQAQTQWQLDFRKPLITLAQAQQAQNSLMSKITAGTPIIGQPTYSGTAPTVGAPQSLAAPSVIPAAGGQAGTSIAGAGSPLAQQLDANPGAFSAGGYNFGPVQ